MRALSIEADLDFTMTLTDGSGATGREVTGHLRGSGAHLELEVSDPAVFAGKADAGFVRGLAEALAARGLSMTVVSPHGPMVVLGARAGWLQRRLTGSRHMRVGSAAGLWAATRARNAASVLPGSEMAPPSTPVPLAPTFLRRPRTVTTTHDPEHGGDPRLIAAPREDWWPGDTQEVHRLRADVTTIGSSPECDVVVAGLEPFHAEVRHDEEDEFVVVRLGPPGSVRVNGEPVAARTLRTASRVTLGGASPVTFTFYREEYADHGRPYGGRVGGEIGHQRPQPPRDTHTTSTRKAAWETP